MSSFIEELTLELKQQESFKCLTNTNSVERLSSPPPSNGNSTIKQLYQSLYSSSIDFEHIVLESALSNIVKKFHRHLEIIQPPLDILLQEIAQDPATYNLRRLLAFRQSLSEFESSV